MDFKSTETLKFPIALVWATMRDQLPDIASAQDDIEYVKVKIRKRETPKCLHVVSNWKSAPKLPGLVKNLIKPDMLIWTDDAHWHDDKHTCLWSIHSNYKDEDIQCTGSIKFEAAGAKATKVTFSGTLHISRTDKSSMLMTNFILKAVESVAGKIIPHNFMSVVKALGEQLKAEA